ncbi:aminopeptidase N [Martelella mediterranea]|uniref:aminopeptidase N n=1 Tax=Martelella mediterranea TaxID=293089 RepID=UPI001E2CC9F5|nr:aminopeptidase N [Martelella mediterranea]MCD1632934.1 aminopeptidase N [Martelella mediterranea]
MRNDRTVYLKDYRQTDFIIESVDLIFELGEELTTVGSQIRMKRRPGASPEAPLEFVGDGLQLAGLALDGKPLLPERYECTSDHLTINDLPADDAFTLTIKTNINPTANTQLLGLYRTNGVYSTQCEAEGFRRITYFYDRPDVLTVYTVTIIADKAKNPLLLSNGNLVEERDLGDGRHLAKWHDPFRKPSYLFALVAGDLAMIEDRFTTMSGRAVTLRIYVEHGKAERADYAMDALKRSMKWDEERFGREYDLDIFMIVAVSDFNMGAMENKGLNIFNDRLILADPKTATDDDYARIEAVVAHEYFHNWTGNRITCRDWFQLSLKEGLTVYREHEFSADQRSRPVVRVDEVKFLRAHQFPEDGGPLAHPVRPTQYMEIDNFYTTTVYEKGSEVSRMIATLLGEDGFRKGLDLFFERHDGGAVTIEDYLKCFEDATSRDLSHFALWYHQAGTPVIGARSSYDAAEGRLELTLSQSTPPTPGESDKKPLHIPLRVGLISPNGDDMEPSAVSGGERTGDVLHLTESEQTFVFEGLGAKPAISLNRDFSAPVRVRFDQPREDRLKIAGAESDLVARWDAINGLALEVLVHATAAVRAGRTVDTDSALASILIETAEDSGLEPAFRALALTLPSELDIGREIGEDVDPDAIHLARKAVFSAIANSGRASFARLVEELREDNGFSPDADSAGRRALRNTALAYLAEAEKSPLPARQAYDAATNMTDMIAALRILAHQFPGSAETSAVLADFRQRFDGEPLVLDKWFTAQATVPGEATLDRVAELMGDPAFDEGNPNRVRALIGAFASSNPTGFNRPDGAGYRFFANFILATDPRNATLTARMMTAMRSFQSLEAGRREKARAEIERIAGQEDLSRNLRDIVNRMLKT